MISTWWTIVNSGSRFHPNRLGNAIIAGDGKVAFMRDFAQWLEKWSTSLKFCFSKQTSDAFIRKLRVQACLVEDLFDEGYTFVCLQRFQSDPLERRFGQYRQMSGGRFLVSLKEVNTSERILQCNSLLKAEISFWEEPTLLPKLISSVEIDTILSALEEAGIDLDSASLSDVSAEVAVFVAGYIGKKLTERSKCDCCKSASTCKDIYPDQCYVTLISNGGLTKPSAALEEFVIYAFTLLDVMNYQQRCQRKNIFPNTYQHQDSPAMSILNGD